MTSNYRLPKVGISVLTLVPLFIFSKKSWARSMVRLSENCFYHGIQMLPLGCISTESLARCNKDLVMSYEGDWRDDSHKCLTALISKLINLLVFGTKQHSRHLMTAIGQSFPNALAVDCPGTSLVEISPRSDLNREAYLNHPEGVVLDTYHLLEQYPDMDVALQLIRDLNKVGQIKLVHFQTRSIFKLLAFIRGKESKLTRIAKLAFLSDADIIVELPPWFALIGRVRLLRKVRERIDTIVLENQYSPPTPIF